MTYSNDKQMTPNNEDDDDDNYYKKILDDLWGQETADYFCHPNFQKSSSIKSIDKDLLTSNDNEKGERLLLGGYPNGMLRGARIPFRSDIKSWLFDLQNNERLLSDKSISSKRRLSTFFNNNYNKHRKSRANSVFNIIDLLKLHLGENPGAQQLWNLLRCKSYEQLTDFEKQLTKEEQFTYAAFTHEYMSLENKKPPLCDFIRENPSSSLSNVLKNLKAPHLEKKLRKVNLAASWAKRNQDQFRILSFQQDLKDAIKTIEDNNFSSSLKGQQVENLNLKAKINRQKANELVSLCPSLKNKQYASFIDSDLQPLENYFPEYSKARSPVKDEEKPLRLKREEKLPGISFWSSVQPTALQQSNEQESLQPIIKPTKHRSKYNKSNVHSKNSSSDNKLQPLCWSDVIAQMHQNYSEEALLTPSSNGSVDGSNTSHCFVKKTLWKPGKAIAS
nr:unnamed protein product [Trichobilharzia regenti]